MVRRWAGVLVCLGICILACGSGVSSEDEGWNLEEEPAQRGPNPRCETGSDLLGEWLCAADGDEERWKCDEIAGTPYRCEKDLYCYDARGTQNAVCITLDELRMTPEGVEPGSAAWEQEKRKRESSSSGSGCCRKCTSGKPCGNSCISVNKNCNSPPGCAC